MFDKVKEAFSDAVTESKDKISKVADDLKTKTEFVAGVCSQNTDDIRIYLNGFVAVNKTVDVVSVTALPSGALMIICKLTK